MIAKTESQDGSVYIYIFSLAGDETGKLNSPKDS